MFALAALFALALPGSEVVRDWLVIPPTDRAGRRPFAPSAVFERHLLAPGLAPPKEGDALTGELGEAKTWAAQKAGEDGSLGGEIGWAYARVESAEARVVMAKLSGASRLFVGGTGYVGDAYAYGFGGVPVTLRKGANDVYVGGVRGSFRLEFVDVASPVVAGSWDHLVPDIVGWAGGAARVGVLVWNASDVAREVVVDGLDRIDPVEEWTPRGSMTMPPGTAWRFAIGSTRIESKGADGTGSPTSRVRLALKSDGAVVQETVEIPVRAVGEAQRVEFASEIDGSMQAYSLLPRKKAGRAEPRVLLSLHGASVDALGQARSYAAKDDVDIVCPTNRRPYGFDWQDWGRLDAYEALDHFLAGRVRDRAADSGLDGHEKELSPAQRRAGFRIVLTGHSMGGHGTWNVAANDPDAFDAIGPSAGWASFDSYGGRPDGALKALWHGADFASKTEELAQNLVPLPTFVLHGTADDNVPASEAHDMIARLEKLGGHPKSHFQEGAGHWWDGEMSAGADCVDYPGILALFDEDTKVDPFAFDWIGADPGVDSRHRWVEVLQPLVYGRPFRVTARRNVPAGTIEIETDNVRALRFDAERALGLRASIDGRSTGKRWPADELWTLTSAGWARSDAPLAGKMPERCGPFKRAFDHRFVLVYGTSGDADEDRELFERARHDQQVWWYRANGTAEIVADTRFLAGDYAGRNVILYGNRDTNAAWKTLVPEGGPFDARRGELRVGTRAWKGDDLGAVCVRPRADDATALVGMFADTGARGSRLGYVLAPFVSGVGYPDYALFSSAILRSGDGGVLAAGWFDRDWNFDAKQYARPE